MAKQYKEFIEQYFSILDRESQIPIPYKLNAVQEKYYQLLLEDYNDFEGIRELVLKARQEGISSFILALFSVDFLMLPYSVSICISHRKDSTDLLFRKVKFYLDSYCIKKGIDKKTLFKSDNKNLIENAENGATFYIGTAGAKVGGRGGSAKNILFSETAFFQDTDLITAEEMVTGTAQQVPQGRGMIFLESTANGEGNYYQQEWERAHEFDEDGKRRSSYAPRFFGWQEFYTEEWINSKKKDFASEAKWHQEYPRCVIGETYVSGKGVFGQMDKRLDKFENGDAEVMKLTTAKGRVLIATPQHKIFTGKNYIPLNELKIGNLIALLPPIFNKKQTIIPVRLGFNSMVSQVIIDKDWARFLGLYMGDGSLYGRNFDYQLSISCDKQDADIIEESERLITKLFAKPNKRIVGSKNGGVEVRVSNKYFKELFYSLDLIRQNGSLQFKRKVHVPNYIMASPRNIIREFLRGLFEADGFIAKTSPRIVLFSQYEDFLRQIQLLLLGFGITSRIVIADKLAGDGHKYIGRELRLNGFEVKKFMEEIGFLSQRKNTRFMNHKYTNKNLTTIEFVDSVASITPLSILPVYDTETPEHYYSANGLWVHNSADEAFVTSGTPYFDAVLLDEMMKAKREPIVMGRLAPDGNFV